MCRRLRVDKKEEEREEEIKYSSKKTQCLRTMWIDAEFKKKWKGSENEEGIKAKPF